MTENIVYQWIKSGLVKPEKQQQALEISGQRSNSNQWIIFIKQTLLILAVVSLAVGVVFFFAFNWNEMNRHLKFAVLQLVLVVFFVMYLLKPSNPWVAQALLVSSVLVLGALLALFGQTYQTGADPWQLFATWALLISPLVILSRSEALWVFMAVLLNLALVLYIEVHRSLFGWFFLNHHLTWAFLGLNGLLLLVLELISDPRLNALTYFRLSHQWASQVLGLMVLSSLTGIGLESIWGNSGGLNMLFYGLLMAASFVYFRLIKKDLLLLTAWSFGLIVFILALIGRTIFESLDAGGLLLMALSLIGMTAVAISWLKKTHLIFKEETLS